MLVAVRHAPTEWNRRAVFMGTLDVPSTTDGLARAAAVGRALAAGPRLDAVLASPLRRAAATAAALFPDTALELDLRLRERHMGEWEGRAKAQVRAEQPEAFPGGHLDVTVTPPGGERFDELLDRVGEVLDELVRRSTGRVVLVTHNGWIRAAQHLCGEATVAEFHAHPTPPLRPVPLPLARWRAGRVRRPVAVGATSCPGPTSPRP